MLYVVALLGGAGMSIGEILRPAVGAIEEHVCRISPVGQEKSAVRKKRRTGEAWDGMAWVNGRLDARSGFKRADWSRYASVDSGSGGGPFLGQRPFFESGKHRSRLARRARRCVCSSMTCSRKEMMK